MTETLLMHALFPSPDSPAPENRSPGSMLELLLTGAMLTSVAGVLASLSIFGAILSGSTFDQDDIPALIACIVVMSIVSVLAWLGMRIAVRDARRQAARLEAILNNISDGVLSLDEQGNFVSANPALLKMIPEDRLRQINAIPLEETLRWKQTVFSVVAAPALDAGSVLIFHDETRRFEAEQAKDALLATASHELRTPLGAVMNYLELLMMLNQTGNADSARFGEYLLRALENSRRLLRLVDDILDQAQLEAGVTQLRDQRFNLPDLLKNALEIVDEQVRKKQLTAGLEIAANVPSEISGDPTRLRKALVSLIENAVKFTRRGDIRVSVTVIDKATLSIEVADSGPGIPPEQLPNIFEAFRRASDYAEREHQGAGLGLAITRQIVVRMGGELSVASTLGAGSTFTVHLPIRR